MKYISITVLLLITGCASINVETENCKASYTSVFKDLSEIRMSACDASGGADSSSNALSEVLLKGMIKGLTP